MTTETVSSIHQDTSHHSSSNCHTNNDEKTHSLSSSFSEATIRHLPSAAPMDPEKSTVDSVSPSLSTTTEANEAGKVNSQVIAPPDGGYGWVVVGACFLNNFSMLGIMFSWGVFQQLYKDEVFPGQTFAVSWIGTLAFGFMYIVGGVFSLFAAKIGYRKMLLTGSILVSGGCVGASFANQVWHLYLTQGILYGLGAAMANPCVLAAPSQWFVQRRGMASGIGISGSGIGGLVFSVIIKKMNSTIGFRWCLRVLGIIIFCSMVVSGMLIRQFSANGARAVNVSMKDVETMRKPAFLILIAGVLTTSFGYFSPLNLLPSYAADHDLTQGAMLNAFLNGASFFGRFAGGVFGDRFGLVNLTVFCVGASALTTLLIWMFAKTIPVLLVYVILYGLMGGGFISLLAPVLAEQFGTSSLTILVGVTFGVNGLGSLLGTPIATAILTSVGGPVPEGATKGANSDQGYRAAVGFIGGIMLLGTIVFFVLRAKVGGKRKAVA